MKEATIKLKSWWAGLALREKQGVALGGILLGLFIIYECTLSPLYTSVSDLREQITADQEILVWMRATDKEIQKAESGSRRKTKVLSPVMLLSVMQKQINHAGLDQYLTQLKQTNNQAVEVHFQKVSFDKLASLIIKVLKEENVSISQFSIAAENEPGVVSANLVLGV